MSLDKEDQLQRLRDENMSLERQIKSLVRSVEERDKHIDKLGKDLGKVS